MNYSLYYHRFSNLLVDGVDEFRFDFNEIISVLNSISDEDLINDFNERRLIRNNIKSLSESINKLLKVRLTELGWIAESPIFREEPYDSTNNSSKHKTTNPLNIPIFVFSPHTEKTFISILTKNMLQTNPLSIPIFVEKIDVTYVMAFNM